MNLRQVFVSLLMFGVAGLLLFMYLQAWIEGQHTGTVGFWFFLCVCVFWGGGWGGAGSAAFFFVLVKVIASMT